MTGQPCLVPCPPGAQSVNEVAPKSPSKVEDTRGTWIGEETTSSHIQGSSWTEAATKAKASLFYCPSSLWGLRCSIYSSHLPRDQRGV